MDGDLLAKIFLVFVFIYLPIGLMTGVSQSSPRTERMIAWVFAWPVFLTIIIVQELKSAWSEG